MTTANANDGNKGKGGNGNGGEGWPYHEDPNGNMVPCSSNPCKLHGGSDVIATSPEEAYAMKHAGDAPAGLSAGTFGGGSDGRSDGAADRAMRIKVLGAFASNDNVKGWKRVHVGNDADDDGFGYVVPSKSSDGSDDEMGVLVKADRNHVSFTTWRKDADGKWQPDGGMIHESMEGVTDEGIRRAVNRDADACAFIAGIPRETNSQKVSDDAAELSKMVSRNSEFLEPDDDASVDDDIQWAYEEMLRDADGYMDGADDGRWYVLEDSPMGVYRMSSTTRNDEYGDPLPIALNDFELSQKECELLSINNQRNDRESIIYHLPDDRMSSIMHDGNLRESVFGRLVSAGEVEYEDYVDEGAIEAEKNSRMYS